MDSENWLPGFVNGVPGNMNLSSINKEIARAH